MAEAEVGDDGYGEDPTVRLLEERYATLVGKQAAVLVPSGVMANQIAIRLATRPGDLVLAGRLSHVVAFELGAAAANAGVQFRALDDTDGPFDPAEVTVARVAAQHHQPTPTLVCVEQTHMPACGAVWDVAELAAVREAAGPLAIHMDGARLLNASVASGVPPATYAAQADTVMTCLSKGLAAPVGSLLAGDADAMEAARTERKRLGGAMRQAGVIAAAGLLALSDMVERLAEDHVRARRLAEAVAEHWPRAGLHPELVVTNVVVVEVPNAQAIVDELATSGVLAGTLGPTTLRLVTHLDVDDAGVDRAVEAIRRLEVQQ
jgi:threonine aldolase